MTKEGDIPMPRTKKQSKIEELEQKELLYSIQPQEFKKHNMLVGSKFKASLLENKVMTLCLSRIKCENIDGQETVYCELRANEIRKIVNAKGGSFYARLDNIAKGMTGRSIGMTNPKTRSFDYMAVVIRASYSDGIFRVKFNPDLKEYIYNIKTNYTNYTMPILMSFESNYAFRLYEVVKSMMYNKRDIQLNLAELKFVTGAANAELDSVRRILNGTVNPDYEKALEVTPEEDYARFSDFRTRALEPAIKEINEKSDINITYKYVTGGVGGKVHRIDIHADYKKEQEDGQKQLPEVIKELTEDEKYALFDELIEEMDGVRFRMKELDMIAKEAGYDKEKILKAYQIMMIKKTLPDNPVGFMIQAIRDDYQEPSWHNTRKKKNSFNNFEQSEYYNQMDLKQLESQLLSN